MRRGRDVVQIEIDLRLRSQEFDGFVAVRAIRMEEDVKPELDPENETVG